MPLSRTRLWRPSRGSIESEFYKLAGFGILQFQFAVPGRLSIFIRPNLQQHHLMTEFA